MALAFTPYTVKYFICLECCLLNMSAEYFQMHSRTLLPWKLSLWTQIRLLLRSILIWIHAGPRSAVGNVSGYRCVSDCRSRGRKFDPGTVPYFRGDWSWNDFYSHSPPFRWFIHEGLLTVTSQSMCTNSWLLELAQEKVWLGELTVPQWP